MLSFDGIDEKKFVWWHGVEDFIVYFANSCGPCCADDGLGDGATTIVKKIATCAIAAATLSIPLDSI